MLLLKTFGSKTAKPLLASLTSAAALVAAEVPAVRAEMGHADVSSEALAEALAKACGGVARTMEDLRGGAVRGDVLANTTSVGMVPDADASPVPKSALEAGGFEVVFDAVYNPLETRLLREAKEAGCAQADIDQALKVHRGVRAESK